MRVEFVEDPVRVFTHKIKNKRIGFFKRVGEADEGHDYAVVFDGDDLIGVANVAEYLPKLALELGNLFDDIKTDRLEELLVYEKRPTFILWWALDDIDLAGEHKSPNHVLAEASAYAERKIIEHVLAQQKEAA